jgi:DNA replication and repair protein RecF
LQRLSRHNIFFGENGSGKTSLLEAVHVLGTARSFRTGRPRSQIQHGKDHYVIYGERAALSGASRSIGVQRNADGSAVLRVAGENTRSVAKLADELPLLALNADSFDLLVGEPGQRRRFLDWGVFHVEHDAREPRKQFQRALTQRNHLLRRGRIIPSELEAWTREVALHGERVSEGRRRFLEALQQHLIPMLGELSPQLESVALTYRRGWDAGKTYLEALQAGLQSDQEQGFTQRGPQRADVRVMVQGYPAAETLSRGQQKLLVAAMKLAQVSLLGEQGSSSLLLVDDLPSELDSSRCRAFCQLLAQLPVQTMITCVDREMVPLSWLSGDESEVALFHVEHGSVSALH